MTNLIKNFFLLKKKYFIFLEHKRLGQFGFLSKITNLSPEGRHYDKKLCLIVKIYSRHL